MKLGVKFNWEIRQFEKYISTPFSHPPVNFFTEKECRNRCFKKITDTATRLIQDKYDSEDVKNLIQAFIKKMFRISYKEPYILFINTVTENLFINALLAEFGSNNFWILPESYLKHWYNSCIKKNKLGLNESKVLLAWLWLYCNDKIDKPGKKKPYATISKIRLFVNMSEKTIIKSLSVLVSKKMIEKDVSTHIGKYLLTKIPFNPKKDFDLKIEIEKSMISNLNKEIDINLLSNLQYVYCSDVGPTNPFVYKSKILKKEDSEKINIFKDYIRLYSKSEVAFIVHKDILNIDYFIASVLTKDQIKQLLKIHYADRSGAYKGLQRFSQKVQDYHNKTHSSFTLPKNITEHYKQIYEVLLIVYYITRRDLNIDPARSIGLSNVYLSQKQMIKEHIIENFNKDSSSFIDQNSLPVNWINKDNKLKNVEISKTENEVNIVFNFKSTKRKLDIKQIKSDQIQEFYNYIKLYDDLQYVLQYAKQQPYMMIKSEFSITQNQTHRIYFKKISTQNISKKNRKVFIARKGHQFFFIDISQMELELLKLYISFEIGPGRELDRTTFEKMARDIGVERSVIKCTFYKLLYGAGESELLKTPGLSYDKYRKFKGYMNNIKEIEQFKKRLEKEASQTYLSRQTPLGYQTPVYGKSYKAMSYLIQSTAAEVFIRWILELHKKGLSEYIVNLIHDEIVFELPVEKNLYDFAKTVKGCLDNASNAISKKIEHALVFNTKQYASKYWNKEDCAEIYVVNRSIQGNI